MKNADKKMASEQANAKEAIAMAVAAATRVAIQAMVAATTERPQNWGPNKDGPAMKQPNFDWEADDKCTKLKKSG